MQDLTITSAAGLSVELADLGARILGVYWNLDDERHSLVRGYHSTAEYMADQFYMGATVGPIANRIRAGAFTLGDRAVQLPVNHSGHSLHSGDLGFDQQSWEVIEQSTNRVCFRLNTPQIKGGLPGKLSTIATYCVKGTQLDITYEVSTNADTYLNLTNHAYWNLNSDQSSIKNHEFELVAHAYALKDDEDIPTGALADIASPFTYSLSDDSMPPELRHQIDHHFVVNENSRQLKAMAKITSPSSGISLLVSSTKPGFQLYSAHFLASPLGPFAGFCVEPQYAPNAINLPEFVSPLVTAQQPYRHAIRYQLSRA